MVNQKLKKEKMRDANKSLYFGILVLVGLSCSSIKNELIPTNNNGGYKMVSSKNDSNSSANEIYIFGNVFDVNTRQPINYANFKSGCYSATANANGEYSFNIKKFNGITYVEVRSILGYKSIQTHPIHLNGLDSLRIDFFLAVDNRPFIDCVEFSR